MIRLLRSELLRIRSRRLVWILLILGLIGIVIGVGIGAAKSRPPTAAESTQLQRTYQRDLHRCLAGKFVSQDQLPPGETLQGFCARTVRPQDYTTGHELELSHLPELLKGVSFILIVMGLVIGASSVGADWQSGTIATLLTWEPRRIRVLLMRIVALTVAILVLTLTLQAVMSGAVWVAAVTRGSTAGVGIGFVRSTSGVALRTGVVAAIGGLLASSISMIGRSTAAALGVMFGYLAVAESLLRGLIPKLTPWLLSTNAVVAVDGRPGSPSSDTIISIERAFLTVAAYAAVLVGAAFVAFRTRDVN